MRGQCNKSFLICNLQICKKNSSPTGFYSLVERLQVRPEEPTPETQVGYNIKCKNYTRLEMFARNKHSSRFYPFTSCEEKSFTILAPGDYTISICNFRKMDNFIRKQVYLIFSVTNTRAWINALAY